jgi:hypothetical protein
METRISFHYLDSLKLENHLFFSINNIVLIKESLILLLVEYINFAIIKILIYLKKLIYLN